MPRQQALCLLAKPVPPNSTPSMAQVRHSDGLFDSLVRLSQARTCMRVEAFKKRGARHSVSEESLNRRLVRLDTRINNQFDLITSRTGWLLTSQAFLFAAFGTILNRSSDSTSVPALELIRTVSFLSMPVVGMLACILVHASVHAAYAAVAEFKGHRVTLLVTASAKFGYENTEPSARITKNGDLPPKVLPGIMFVIWSVMLVLVIVALTIPSAVKCSP